MKLGLTIATQPPTTTKMTTDMDTQPNRHPTAWEVFLSIGSLLLFGVVGGISLWLRRWRRSRRSEKEATLKETRDEL